MRYKSIYFTAIDYNSVNSTIFKDSKESGRHIITGTLYYYPELQTLIQALKDGKDISARITYTQYVNSGYVGPIYNSSNANVQVANSDTSNLIASTAIDTDPVDESTVVEPVSLTSYYIRNGIEFQIIESAIAYIGDADEFTYKDLPDVMRILDNESKAAEDQIENYFHTLVGITTMDFDGYASTLWLTDEPAENFDSIYVMTKDQDEESGGQQK